MSVSKKSTKTARRSDDKYDVPEETIVQAPAEPSLATARMPVTASSRPAVSSTVPALPPVVKNKSAHKITTARKAPESEPGSSSEEEGGGRQSRRSKKSKNSKRSKTSKKPKKKKKKTSTESKQEQTGTESRKEQTGIESKKSSKESKKSTKSTKERSSKKERKKSKKEAPKMEMTKDSPSTALDKSQVETMMKSMMQSMITQKSMPSRMEAPRTAIMPPRTGMHPGMQPRTGMLPVMQPRTAMLPVGKPPEVDDDDDDDEEKPVPKAILYARNRENMYWQWPLIVLSMVIFFVGFFTLIILAGQRWNDWQVIEAFNCV